VCGALFDRGAAAVEYELDGNGELVAVVAPEGPWRCSACIINPPARDAGPPRSDQRR